MNRFSSGAHPSWSFRTFYAYEPSRILTDVEYQFRSPVRVFPCGDDWRLIGAGHYDERAPTLPLLLKEFARRMANDGGQRRIECPDGSTNEVTTLSHSLEMGGRVSDKEADAIVRSAYFKGLSVKEAQRLLRRAERARYPNLREFMPPRSSWPKHAIFKGHVRLGSWGPSDKPYALTLYPWARMNQQWWSLSRRGIVRGESIVVARVYLNGSGFDHELRFHVYSPDRSLPSEGAANDHCRVTPMLLKHFGHRLGARGLSMPMPEDVLDVMAWCDERIDVLWKES